MASTKGTHVLNAVKVLRQSRERALTALRPALHKYLDQRILPSSWYPLDEQLELLRVIAGLMPPAPDPWLIIGRGTARMDLTGVYRSYLRAGHPERMLSSLSALWRSAHDSGEAIVCFDVAGGALITVRHFDLRSREYCRVTTGYLMELVALSGARDERVVHTRCRCVDNGPECVWKATWAPLSVR
jgi:hypothetical protein